MEEERSLAARENTELVSPGGSQDTRLLEVVDNFKGISAVNLENLGLEKN